jgi:hypothetical protein
VIAAEEAMPIDRRRVALNKARTIDELNKALLDYRERLSLLIRSKVLPIKNE